MKPETRALVLERDNYQCQRCGAPGTNIHHRRPRGMGGTRRRDTNTPVNLITLCGSGTTGCHGWIESHRDEARELGFLVVQAGVPALVPVQTINGQVFLTADGRQIPAATEPPF